MARLPKDIDDAVALFEFDAEATLVTVGPAPGFVEALAEVVGTKGSVVVTDPPPDVNARKKAISVVEELGDDVTADAVIVWMGIVQPHDLRTLVGKVRDGGTLWTVLAKGTKDFRASVTEGDVKKTLLTLGWRETKVVGLSTEDYAVRFHRRR